jgi:hypothetical protein
VCTGQIQLYFKAGKTALQIYKLHKGKNLNYTHVISISRHQVIVALHFVIETGHIYAGGTQEFPELLKTLFKVFVQV